MSLGQRIKLSRLASGLSLRNLESKIDHRVTAQAISKYERDESVPSSGVLIALARALDVKEDYLVSDIDIVLEKVEFRIKHKISKREEAQLEAQILDLLERYLTVEEFLGLPTVVWDMPRDAPWPVWHNLAEVEQASLSLRRHWHLGLDPISNIVELFEERGIKILSIYLSKIDGLVAQVRREDKTVVSVIVVNQSHSRERQRFTVAHELGRLVLDVASSIDSEKAAHRFAGAFLMPAETLRAEIGKHRKTMSWYELFALKTIFGVSVQALTHRCRELGIFDNSLFQLLLAKFRSRGWSNPPFKEPHETIGEKPKRFERLCYRAVTEGAISEAKAAELLKISVHELVRLIDEPPVVEKKLLKTQPV